MDKLKKVGLTALGTALVSTAAYAGELSVTGSAAITFAGSDNGDDGNTWSASDTLVFSGSADLDNGMTVTLTHKIDGGTNDINTIGIDTGGMGTISFYGQDGTGPIGGWDDMTPSANEESWALVNGTVTAAASGASADNSFAYTNSDLMDGLSLTIFHAPSDGATELKSSTEYGAQYTGIEGLTVGFASGENNAAATSIDSTNMYVTYAMDAFTIGVQDNATDSEGSNADSDFRAYGISYAVSDDLSVSYNVSKVEHENTSLEDQDATGMSVSYTNGSVTLSASMNEVDNVAGTATTDNSGYEINFTFAF